jgi:hypothetical protein
MFPTKVSIEKGFKEHALWLFDTIDKDTLALHATNVVSVTIEEDRLRSGYRTQFPRYTLSSDRL